MARRGRKPGLRAAKRKLEILLARELRIQRRYSIAKAKARELETELLNAKDAVINQRNRMRESMGYVGFGE